MEMGGGAGKLVIIDVRVRERLRECRWLRLPLILGYLTGDLPVALRLPDGDSTTGLRLLSPESSWSSGLIESMVSNDVIEPIDVLEVRF